MCAGDADAPVPMPEAASMLAAAPAVTKEERKKKRREKKQAERDCQLQEKPKLAAAMPGAPHGQK